MPYSHVEIKQFTGLFLQPNSFSVPNGALEMAKNCVISHDYTIEKRPGFYDYYTPGSGTLNNLFTYQDKLIAVSSTEVRYDMSGTFTLNGAISLAAGAVCRAAEAGKNLYLTSSSGVKKLSAYNSGVENVGIPPALDIRCELTGASGIIASGNSVSYRILFGRRDANESIYLGAPSDIVEVTATGSAKTPVVEASIPSEITTTDFFYQIYRTSQSSTEVLPDYRLVKEAKLTASDLSLGFVFYTDTVIDDIRDGAAELYTNPNSQEGELQANNRPPLCDDMALYKDTMLYAATTTRHTLQGLFVASTSGSFINNNNWIEIAQNTTRRYVARSGSANNTAQCTVGVVGVTATITFPSAHGLVTGDTVTVFNANGSQPIAAGNYVATVTGATTLTITVVSGDNSTTALVYGLHNAAGERIFELSTASSPANLEFTAQGIVKAINRDPSATFYASYLSSVAQTVGNIRLESKSFSTTPIQVRAENVTVGQAFSPELPASFSSDVQSDQEVKPNSIYASKVGEPEAVPFTNQIIVGSENKRILRIFALRDSVVVLREDGVYRLDGDNIANFQATLIDNTVFCLSASSADLLNGQVHFLSNQGICAASSTAVEIISRSIELPVSAVLGNTNLAAQTSGKGYESARLYLLTTLAPRQNTASECYVFNTLTRAWSTWDTYFKNATVGPGDKLYYISQGNKVRTQRKQQNKLDYTDQDYPITVTSVASGNLSAVIISPSYSPQVGDAILKGDTISRIKTVSGLGPSYTVTFNAQTTLEAADAVDIYQRISSLVKHSPFHAGEVGRGKHFSQLQIHSRDNSFNFADIFFATSVYGASDVVSWFSSNVKDIGAGWGSLPWGFFPWGLDNTTDLTYDTQPATPVRVYVPLNAQRATWIQAVIEHKMGAEQMNIQAISYAVRGYGERVTR